MPSAVPPSNRLLLIVRPSGLPLLLPIASTATRPSAPIWSQSWPLKVSRSITMLLEAFI